MAVPTSPYTDSATVALLMPTLLNRATDFGPDTPITKDVVDRIITWVSSVVEMTFAEVGYVIPFQELEGETWPTSQTDYLQYVTALGTAAHILSTTLKPAPATGQGRVGTQESNFKLGFEDELHKIRTVLPFRALAVVGSAADNRLADIYGATTDVVAGMQTDPTQYMGIREIADRVQRLKVYFRNAKSDLLFGEDEAFNGSPVI